jgi:hypothetical protein
VFLDGADEVDASIVDEIVDRAEALLGLTKGPAPLLSSLTVISGNDIPSAASAPLLRAARTTRSPCFRTCAASAQSSPLEAPVVSRGDSFERLLGSGVMVAATPSAPRCRSRVNRGTFHNQRAPSSLFPWLSFVGTSR